ncbi:cation:proton antiporter domain-containing protein, partial [Serratia marcescens]|uniref:cation:proton antiporter domain-containing protein n=1 Tax=Serratia marcescens TaxID=615 RepID=UPI0019540BEA
LGTTAVTVPILARFGISSVIGFLGIGALLGPFGVGRLVDGLPWLRWIAVSDSREISVFAELGVVFLLFLIGLELSYERLT